MSERKMFSIYYHKNGREYTEYRACDMAHLKELEKYFFDKRKPDGQIVVSVVYRIGDIIEVKDEWAEDESNGRTKYAVITRFDVDRIAVEMGWEHLLISPFGEYKVVGRVSVNDDGYIADRDEVREVLRRKIVA